MLLCPVPAMLALAPPSSCYVWKGSNKITGDSQNTHRIRRNFLVECSAISEKSAEVAVLRWRTRTKVSRKRETSEEYISAIRSMLASMGDGEITTSAYDTAWVAMVETADGDGAQFPSTLTWIADNQLDDGSWGDERLFSAHDRVLNTLACVIALKKWRIHAEGCARGVEFLKQNMNKLEDEKTEHMPIGFEVAFPSLVDKARSFAIEVPTSLRFWKSINAKRAMKLKRIPKEAIHEVATTLLHSLEGLPDLDWEKLLKLQCENGSFLFSPSSTACALMHTGDSNCLRYLTEIVRKFNGAVPNVYPVDLFEHVWVIDRLQRLGIAQYFHHEIKQCVDHVRRHWTTRGICWARNSPVQDIDDTSMAFRVLRMNGYDVSSEVFRHFNAGEEFFCFLGQCTQGLTGIYNLLRASQLSFPGEDMLTRARSFASMFLREKQAANRLYDKWIIQKDLPGEVAYALDIPWYASLPRVETRLYLEQYGGNDDVWIGKTLYRMPLVSNDIYLKLAKLDYHECQRLHQLEWDKIRKWYARLNLGAYGADGKSLMTAYFLAAASIYEPERSMERFAWAQTAVLVKALSSHFEEDNKKTNRRKSFVKEFKSVSANRNNRLSDVKRSDDLLEALITTINQQSLDSLVAHESDIIHHLSHAWEMWLDQWLVEPERQPAEVELIVRTMCLVAGHEIGDDTLHHHRFKYLSALASGICNQLQQLQRQHEDNHDKKFNGTNPQVELDMQRLVQAVFQNYSGDIDRRIKETFLTVVKTHYYSTFCNSHVIETHISKVLFERVL